MTTPSDRTGPTGSADPSGSGNGKTALVLLSIALVFFAGVIANRILFG